VAAPAPAVGVVVVLAVAPIALWHHVLRDVIVSFHWSLSYAMAELGPWLLLLAGVGCLLPVAISSGRDPESRLYPRARRAYFIWGVVLYLLGGVLAIELFDVWSYAH
jgi:hypothetical protein